MPSKRKKDSDALDRLMNSLKIKLTKLTRNRGKFVDCMAKFSSIYIQFLPDIGIGKAVNDRIKRAIQKYNS